MKLSVTKLLVWNVGLLAFPC